MERVPEPELMDEPAQVAAYAAADFAAPHDLFVALLRDRLRDVRPRRVLDLGCGPCDVTRRFARAFPGCAITAIDGSAPMLAEARRRNADAGLEARIALVHARLPSPALRRGEYDLVLTNSLLHHLEDPMVLWHAARDAAAPAAAVFAMDLLRPDDADTANQLVAIHAAGEPEVLRRDFHASLLAAYRPDEVRAQLLAAGLPALRLEVVSDRHWIGWGHLA